MPVGPRPLTCLGPLENMVIAPAYGRAGCCAAAALRVAVPAESSKIDGVDNGDSTRFWYEKHGRRGPRDQSPTFQRRPVVARRLHVAPERRPVERPRALQLSLRRPLPRRSPAPTRAAGRGRRWRPRCRAARRASATTARKASLVSASSTRAAPHSPRATPPPPPPSEPPPWSEGTRQRRRSPAARPTPRSRRRQIGTRSRPTSPRASPVCATARSCCSRGSRPLSRSGSARGSEGDQDCRVPDGARSACAGRATFPTACAQLSGRSGAGSRCSAAEYRRA